MIDNKTERLLEARQAFLQENPEYDLNLSPAKQEWFRTLTKEEQKTVLNRLNQKEREWKAKHDPALLNAQLERECVLDLAANKRRSSTEKAVDILKREYTIKSLRDDKNPEMWIYHKGIYVPNAESFIEARVRIIYEEAYTTTLKNEIVAKIRADTYIDQKEFFDAEPINKVCVENGIINLETLEQTLHTPEEIHFTRLPVTYDPAAECPAIMKHLQAVIRHEDDLPVMQEIFGWFLWKEYKPERAVMLLGSGRNGKGKTVEVMKRFLGPANVAGVPLQDLDERPFSIAELHKKLANIGADLPKNALAETGRFKNLTGGDYISADRKHQSMLHFTNYAKMVYAANKLPVTYDVSHAFFARWIIIDFPYKFYEQDEYDRLSAAEKEYARVRDVDIIDKIATAGELSGLLNWALQGFLRLKERGAFSYSKNTAEVTNMWVRRSDSFAAFCQDSIVEKWDGQVLKSDLLREYSTYCREHKVEMVSEKMMKRYLAETFGSQDDRVMLDGDRVLVWKGIVFHDSVTIARVGRHDRGISLNREFSKSDIGVKTGGNPANPGRHTTDSVLENSQTLNVDSLFEDLLLHPSDNEAFLHEKYSKKQIDHWEVTGEIFRPKPGTYRRLR
ncbi:MAG: phage/plasmid primase, P4 family [Actinobacteria bacterium]|nr:phage/plasmid primase, P4 family [Actinomycetota bacterium]